jgi:hypothetical protein
LVSNNLCIFSGSNHQVVGDLVSNGTGIYAGSNHQITGNLVSTIYGIRGGSNHRIAGDLVSNGTGIYAGSNHRITGDFSNTTNFSAIPNASAIKSAILEDCTFAGVNRMPFRCYSNSGTILSLMYSDDDWQAPPSNNAYIFEVTPNSYCNTSYAGNIPLSSADKMACIATAEETTLTFKIYPVGWTSTLTQDDVIFEVSYLDSVSGITRTMIYSTSQTYANDGWRDCSVTFTPGQAGVVYFQLYFTKYESGCTVLVDPEWVVS